MLIYKQIAKRKFYKKLILFYNNQILHILAKALFNLFYTASNRYYSEWVLMSED